MSGGRVDHGLVYVRLGCRASMEPLLVSGGRDGGDSKLAALSLASMEPPLVSGGRAALLPLNRLIGVVLQWSRRW